MVPIENLFDTLASYILPALIVAPLVATVAMIAAEYGRKAVCALTKPRPSFLTDDERRNRIRAELHGAPPVALRRR